MIMWLSAYKLPLYRYQNCWIGSNRKINSSACIEIHFFFLNRNALLSYTTKTKPILQSVRYLGVLLWHRLTWCLAADFERFLDQFLIDAIPGGFDPSQHDFERRSFRLPLAVYSLSSSPAIQASYISCKAALKGLFQQTSGAWRCLVHPPGITAVVMLYPHFNSLFVASLRWHL